MGLEGGGEELVEGGVRLDEVAGGAVYDLVVAGGEVADVEVHVALAEDEVVVEVFVVAPAEVGFDEPFDGGVGRPGDGGGLAGVDEEAVVIEAVLGAEEGGVLFGDFGAEFLSRPAPQPVQTFFRAGRLGPLAVLGLFGPDLGQ